MTNVTTTHGAVEGAVRDGHSVYLGIPFAAPPVGEGRFRAPLPLQAWDGVRPATEWGKAARQTSHPIPGFAASGPQDEDCLYLNVFTPAADGKRRPVLFWIHGGGFTHGSAAEPIYDGGPLAVRGDVVVVSTHYRLGALGFLHLDDHLPGRGLSANTGMLDLVSALEWTRDNVERFGGDPGNVTIFGESAGAAAVGTLLAMPAAKGLFHKAVLQSGTVEARAFFILWVLGLAMSILAGFRDQVTIAPARVGWTYGPLMALGILAFVMLPAVPIANWLGWLRGYRLAFDVLAVVVAAKWVLAHLHFLRLA